MYIRIWKGVVVAYFKEVRLHPPGNRGYSEQWNSQKSSHDVNRTALEYKLTSLPLHYNTVFCSPTQ